MKKIPKHKYNQAVPKVCPKCKSNQLILKGRRNNHFQILQIYQCQNPECKTFFSQNPAKNFSYPLRIQIKAISFYNAGYTQTKVSKLMSARYKIRIPQRTISFWKNYYQDLCTFSRFRKKAILLYPPEQMIFSKKLYHQQVYNFQFHRAKLDILLNPASYGFEHRHDENHAKFSVLSSYLNKIPTKEFPHRIFSQDDKNRASQIRPFFLKTTKLQKQNYANLLAEIALKTTKTNTERHQIIQDFMLHNDSTTVATEVPVYFTREDADYFRKLGFRIAIPNSAFPITGHIDIIQIRNNLLHILDYKPEAGKGFYKQQAPTQLTIYALALANRLRIPLKNIKCAWFDHKDYYEFFPLHAVYSKR